MKPLFRRTFRNAIVFALAFVAALGVLSVLASGSANFLGKDVSSIAASVVGFYPWVAVAEVLKVLSIAFATAFFLVLPFSWWACHGARLRWVVFPVLPLFTYLLWWCGALLKYPALVDDRLPQPLSYGIFRAAFQISPELLFVFAGAAYLIPLWGATVQWRRSGFIHARKILASASVVAAVGVGTHILNHAPSAHALVRSPTRPNILFVAIDSLRFDRLHNAIVTPQLRKLLEDPQSVLLADHFVGIPRTFPSWIEIIEGRYAGKTGVRHMFPGFGARSKEVQGLGTVFQEAGYATSVVSDFAGDIFPRFEGGFENVDAPNLTLMTMIRMSADQMFAGFLPIFVTPPWRSFFPAMRQIPAFADPSYLVDRSAKWMQPNDKPWFTTLFFSTAHFPYSAPYPFYRSFADENYRGVFRFQKNPEVGVGGERVNQPDVQQIRALYDGAIQSVDVALGDLFANLKRQGLWDSTLIVVTADHGEDLFENGRLQGHGEHLRGDNVLKVPVIMKLPLATRPTLKTYLGTSRSIDLASTVAGIAGFVGPIGDGVNLLPWLVADARQPLELSAFAETGIWFSRSGSGFFQEKRLDYPGISGLLNFDQGYSGEIVLNSAYERSIVTAKHRMLIRGDWKIIYMPTESGVSYELYNRRLDPENLKNLVDVEPDRLQEMKGYLWAMIRDQEKLGTKVVDEFVVPPWN